MNAGKRPTPVVNFLLYQITWLACVMGAAKGQPLIGVGVALVVIGLHLASSRNTMGEMQIILIAGLIGGLWETLLISQDWVRYADSVGPWLPPSWIIALWMAFATTFNVSLRWLQDHLFLGAALGLVGGPLAWYAGARLGALTLPEPILSLSILGLGWAVLMPLLLWLAQRMEQRTIDPTLPKTG
jgi:hypothetical protein